MKMKVISESDGFFEIAITGEITQMLADEDREPLAIQFGDEVYRRAILVDLAKTEFIDSSGIGWLIGVVKKFNNEGGKLILHSIPPMIMQTIRLLRIEKLLSIAPGRPDALNMAGAS